MNVSNNRRLAILLSHALPAIILAVMLSISAAIKPPEYLARASTDLADPTFTYLPMLTKYVLDPLDSSFGEGGVVLADLADYESPGALGIQPDGKLILAGNASFLTEGDDLVLLRFNPDGSPDLSFDGDGILITDLGGYDYAKALAIQPDGKIVVAGYSIPLGDPLSSSVLVRYNPDGSLDTGFGTQGIVTVNLGKDDIFSAVTLQPDGKIVAGGKIADPDVEGEDISLARFNSSGSLDISFSENGFLTADYSLYDTIEALAVQIDGKIIATGLVAEDLAVFRYLSNGNLDAGFGTGGLAKVDAGSAWNIGLDVAIQPDGKILVSGLTDRWTDSDFLLVRFSTNGGLDTTFSTDGVVATDIGTEEYGNSLGLHSDGRIVMAGSIDGDFALLVYHPDGSLDVSFGRQGILTIDIFGNYDYGKSLVIQADGKIVLGGTARYDTLDHCFTIIRTK